MVEAPSDLEALFKSQAVANGVAIIRDEPLSCGVALRNIPTRRFSFTGRTAPIAFTCLCQSALLRDVLDDIARINMGAINDVRVPALPRD